VQPIIERDWLCEFERSRAGRLAIDWTHPVRIDLRGRRVLSRSLQRFQVGETGDGRHLLAAARRLNEPRFAAAMALFVAEEQHHALLLARLLDRLESPRLRWHWSDVAFTAIRRVSGLRTELMVLLVAELVATVYYQALQDGSVDTVLRDVCSQILADEQRHVAFHCDTLRRLLRRVPSPALRVLRLCWRFFYGCVCATVALDHGAALAACGLTRRAFLRATAEALHQATEAIFAPCTRAPVAPPLPRTVAPPRAPRPR
jgi:hypothetical protein